MRVEGLSKIIASVLPASGRSAGTPLRLALRLHGAARLDHPAQLGLGDVGQIEEMADAVRAHPAAPCLRGRCVRRGKPRAGALDARAPPRRSPPRSTISGGSSRTTLSPAATVIIFSARSSSTSSAVRHDRAQAEQQALAAHFGDHGRKAVLDRGELLLEQERHAPHAVEEARRQHARRAPHCRPPWRADCRRRSSRGCRRSCPCRPPRWRGRRRAESRRRAPWRAP